MKIHIKNKVKNRTMRFKTVSCIICIIIMGILSGCSRQQSANLNNKMKTQTTVSKEATNNENVSENSKDKNSADESDISSEVADSTDNYDGSSQAGADPEYQAAIATGTEDVSNPETKDYGKPDAQGRVGYQCDVEADKKNFDGKVDIVVGDNLYTTQINDWYVNFDQYEGKTVEIEGYFIDDYAPYTFIGRYGPTCPYCNGGYVSFEFYSQDDISSLKSVEDWIKVIGILRQGEDSSGKFYYIEVLSLEKMDKKGKDTVTN